VFDADGGGMQFVAFEVKERVADSREARRNPLLGRSGMRAVMAGSLSLYLGRNAGRLPRRLVVHKTTSFKDEELQGVFDGLSTVREVERIEIGSIVTWRGAWLKQGKTGGLRSVPGSIERRGIGCRQAVSTLVDATNPLGRQAAGWKG
jgi:hypothetical protein